MTIFAISIMPLCLILWALTYGEKKYTIAFFTGLLSGVAVTAFKGFFTFIHRITPYSFADNFVYLLVREAVLPVVILYGIYLLISHDDLEFKAKSFFPLVSAFYITFLPFIILSGNKAIHTHFELFLKPVIMEIMIFVLAGAVKEFAACLKGKKKLIFIPVLIFLIYIAGPALIEAAFTIHMAPVVYISASAAYILLPAISLVLLSLKGKKTEETEENS